MTLSVVPETQEIEISLLGPGYGECAVIHIGGGQWVIVDSCLDTDSQPAALAYLRNLGIDPSESVCLVIATHWHDDHIRGMGELVRVCANARFCCGSALRTEEFLTVLGTLENRPARPTGSGMKEMHQVFLTLIETPDRGIYALADRLLFSRDSCTIWSLSPSDRAYQKFLREINRLVPDELEPKTRIPSLTPNEAAVVLMISMDGTAILLGADLEKGGWLEIVDGSAVPGLAASVFKVPHHGSEDAHEDRVWNELLCEDPIALLTPWRRGGRALPTPNDVQRILSFTDRAYVTTSRGHFESTAMQSRGYEIQRTIRETGARIAPVPLSRGLVRLRKKAQPSGGWTVEQFGSACELIDY